MYTTYIVLLFLVLATTLERAQAGAAQWSFKNWNKYKNSKATSEREAWWGAWGISAKNGWAWPHKSSGIHKNHDIVPDPMRGTDQVLRVTYPAGSYNPADNPQGGIGFYAEPFTLHKEAKTVVLEYQVYFPKKFDFVKGGKLPGLYGGHEGCSGGANANTCYSTRFMWRRKGAGEVYAYMPESKQRDDLCDEKGNVCNPNYGYSLGRGSWTFKTGQWVKIRQTLKLNTPGQQNGMVRVDVNGKQVYSEDKLVFLNRGTKSRVVGIAFHTFFGGNGPDWATPKTQYTYFKGFSLKAYY